MTKSIPLITIGITCFNAAETIRRAIESAQKQDWLNFEIIIVDDGSKDNSAKIIKTFQENNEKINLFRHKENQGYPAALNTIIKNAKGEYIAFFDDDDEHSTDRLTKQYKRLTKFQTQHPGCAVLCYSHRRVFINGIEKSDGFVKAIGHKTPEPHDSMVADFLLWHKKVKNYVWGQFGSCTMMASKKILEEFGFDTSFRRAAEWDLAIRVALKGGYFISVDKPLVIQHKTQTIDKSGTKPLQYALMLRKKHKKYLQKHKVYLGAILQSYAKFYYFRNKSWKGHFFLILACLLPPFKIFVSEIEKRIR